MSGSPIKVTHMRRDEAVEYLDRVARGIAQTTGPVCETLVQELAEDGHCTVLSIYNGHVSGRQVGSTLSIYGTDTCGEGDDVNLASIEDMVSLEAVTAQGKRVKSSSWFLRGRGYVLILGMNLDVTALLQVQDVVTGLASVGADLRESLSGAKPREGAAPEALIDECLHLVGKPAEALGRDDRFELVRLLDERGFFEFQKGTLILASRLGVSRGTIYGDLRALRK